MAATTENTHPLVGAGLHIKVDNVVERQAHILAVIPSSSPSGDLALIEFFGWMMGEPTTRRLISLAELATDERFVLYPSVIAMNEHYERVDSGQSQHRKKGGGYEDLLKMDTASSGSLFKTAVIETLDTVEYVKRWLIDQDIKPEPGMLAELSALVMKRFDNLQDQPSSD